MHTKEITFNIHDVTAFPIVRQRPEALVPGYAAQWERELERLLGRATPFVVILSGGLPEETHEDRRSRGIWLKRNKALLALGCKAVIGIEPNVVRRAALKAQALLAAKAFGTSMDVVGSDEEAVALAQTILDAAQA
ncbi:MULTISPECIES: hypothetical protein [Rhizobium]|uniref:hypothetical protein n=1 Tax=Rhizobium TaxID=379 RepID=UPI00195D2C72|nr:MULTISPECIES: hypothetical protein [Rhizobium]MBM7046718.1 hypothetical protein [Rhizobium lusitanum]